MDVSWTDHTHATCRCYSCLYYGCTDGKILIYPMNPVPIDFTNNRYLSRLNPVCCCYFHYGCADNEITYIPPMNPFLIDLMNDHSLSMLENMFKQIYVSTLTFNASKESQDISTKLGLGEKQLVQQYLRNDERIGMQYLCTKYSDEPRNRGSSLGGIRMISRSL